MNMTDMSRKKESCIKIIRSHLISSPSGLTLWQLEQDYVSSEKQKVPYRKFGHADLLSFLKSLPNVVRIDYKKDGQLVLHGVADESSLHVKRLVDRQKKKPLKRPPPLLAPARRPASSAMAARRHMGQVSRVVRQSISKIVQSQASGIAIPAFLDVYRKEIGVSLNAQRQGFRSLPDLFLSIPEICRLDYGRRDRSGNTLYLFPPKTAACARKDADILKDLDANAQRLVGRNDAGKDPACPAEPATAKHEKVETMCIENESEVSQAGKCLSNVPQKVEQPEKTKNPELLTPVPPSCNIFRARILEILEDQPNGVWSTRICAMYKEKYGHDMEFQKLGYFSIVEFVSTLSNEISISRPLPKSDWLLVKRSLREKKNRNTYTVDCFDESLEVTKMEIKEILITSENGILLEKLSETYERTYRHGVNLGDDTLDGLIMFVLQIEGCIVHRRKGKLNVTLANDEKLAMTGGQSPSNLLQFPIDAALRNASYKQLKLPTMDVQYIDVFVADVTSPEYFFVQICGTQTTGALNELMDALERFYCSPECDKYRFPTTLLKVGQICATVFFEDLNWHRAVIVTIYEADFVDVLYVDYGSVANVPVSSLRLLKSCFLTLPAQMVEARLSNIQPRNLTSWTLAARDSMLDMCRDRPLVAIITDIKDRVLSVCLCDTTEPDVDLHINDTLVEKKHAVFFPDGLSDEQQGKLRCFLLQQIEAENSGEVVDFDDAAMSLLSSVTVSSEAELVKSRHPEASSSGKNHDKHMGGAQKLLEDIAEKNVATGSCQYVQKRSVANGKYTLHVINYEDNPMLASFEISGLFHQASDMLRPLLHMKNLSCEELIVVDDGKHAKLFEALHEHRVFPKASKVTESVICLYQLSDLPTIVKAIGHENAAVLVSDVRRILRDLEASSKCRFSDENFSHKELAALQEVQKDLLASRKTVIERLSTRSGQMDVEKVIAIEKVICENGEKIKRLSSTCPKEVMVNSDRSSLGDAMMSQYNSQGRSADSMEVQGKDQNLILESDVTARVAQIAPSIRNTVSKEGPGEFEQLWSIPGAHVQHDVIQFFPYARNATGIGTATQTPAFINPGSSGAANWNHSESAGAIQSRQGIDMPQHSHPQIGIQGRTNTIVTNGFAQPTVTFSPQGGVINRGTQSRVAVGVPQWTQWPLQQQVSGTPTGQVYLGQIGSSDGNSLSVQGHSGLVAYPSQRQSVTLQPESFSWFLPLRQ